MKACHNMDININEAIFQNEEQCDEFIKELEAESKLTFQTRSSRPGYVLKKCVKDMAYREATEKNQLEREPKSHIVKENFNCPSFLIKQLKGGACYLKYVNHHTHEINDYFVHLDPEIKNDIAIKLSVGISPSRVLSETRQSYPEYLISIKDIENIKQTVETRFDKNDKIACEIISNENQSVKILSYGENIKIFVQTDGQKKFLTEKIDSFGIDSTHCTNRYGFYLTTLHALPKQKKGFPVGFFISTDEKQASIESFLEQFKPFIREKVTLVTDDYPAYTNAWQKVIGDHYHHQCMWHLVKNWKINLNKTGITGNYNKKNRYFDKKNIGSVYVEFKTRRILSKKTMNSQKFYSRAFLE